MLERPWIRRFGIPLLAALSIGVFVGMVLSADGDDAPARDDAIVALIPNDGDEVLAQSSVGISLKPGYAADLVINGTSIPTSQVREVDGTFVFRPDQGNVITELLPDTNCALAFYWPLAQDRATASSITWCFTAS